VKPKVKKEVKKAAPAEAAPAKAAAPKAAAPKAAAPKAAPKPAAPKAAPKAEEKVKPRQSNVENLPPKSDGNKEGRKPRDHDKADRLKTDKVREEKGFVKTVKRVHDRRSATGRAPNENSKGGAGKGNWGKLGSEQDIEALDEEEKTEKTEEPRKLTPEEEEKLKEEEKEAKMVTLEEYRKQQAELKANIPLPEIRKAGEGDNKKWGETQEFKRKEEVLFSVSTKKKGNAAKPTAETPAKKSETAVPFTDVLNIKAERKERGRGPRAGGKGGNRRENKEEFKLNDQAFPSLKETAKA
jgi:hypothetical protein